MGYVLSKTREDKTLESKMERLKVKKITTGETFGADQVLFDQVMMKLNEKHMKKKKHIIVFCPITSRVGSDVKAAMEAVKRWTNNEEQADTAQDDQGIILVLMHHTRDPDYATAGIIYCETISNVDLNVHVLFHETLQGLLKCSQNEKAVDEIVDFLRQEPPTKQKEEKMKEQSQNQNVTGVVTEQITDKTEDNEICQNAEKSKDNAAAKITEKTEDNSVGQHPEKAKDNEICQNSEKNEDNATAKITEKKEDNSVGQRPEKSENN